MPAATTSQFDIDSTVLADMELQAYLASQQGAGEAKLNAQTTLRTVDQAKKSHFMDITSQIEGADNSITNAAFYLLRTNDLKNMATDVDTATLKQLNVLTSNADKSARQYEINEWENSNKLDTLYFMQVLFLSLTFIAILVYLQSRNIIPPIVFYTLASISLVLAIICLILRARYTHVLRDPRYWHKTRFPSQPNAFPNPAPAAPSETCN